MKVPALLNSVRIPLSGACGSIWMGMVTNVLKKMERGSLDLYLSNGEVHRFGKEQTGTPAEVHVRNDSFFKRCVLYADVGFGESYVEGDWDSPDITAVISWMILNIQSNPVLSGNQGAYNPLNWFKGLNRLYHSARRNHIRGSQRNIHDHYDLGNAFYRLFLDQGMTYSSGFFRSGSETLEEAQTEKYDRLCQKLCLDPGDSILEIGCGWGGFACHAAQHYGAKVTGITLSSAQFEWAQRRVNHLGLQSQVTILLQDYRRTVGQYDKVVSIEMIEAVGDEFLETFFNLCGQWLRKDGLLALQMITCPDSRYQSLRRGVDWIQKHIFPGSLLISLQRVGEAMVRTGDLTLHHLESFGPDYATTLRMWRERFEANIEKVHGYGFDTAFVRKWNYYLSYCEAAFSMRNINVVQAIYTRPNNLNVKQNTC